MYRCKSTGGVARHAYVWGWGVHVCGVSSEHEVYASVRAHVQRSEEAIGYPLYHSPRHSPTEAISLSGKLTSKQASPGDLLPSLGPHGLHATCTSLSPVLGQQGNKARRELGTSRVFVKHVISCLRVLSTAPNTHSSIFRPHHNGECEDNMLSFHQWVPYGLQGEPFCLTWLCCPCQVSGKANVLTMEWPGHCQAWCGHRVKTDHVHTNHAVRFSRTHSPSTKVGENVGLNVAQQPLPLSKAVPCYQCMLPCTACSPFSMKVHKRTQTIRLPLTSIYKATNRILLPSA